MIMMVFLWMASSQTVSHSGNSAFFANRDDVAEFLAPDAPQARVARHGTPARHAASSARLASPALSFNSCLSFTGLSMEWYNCW